MAFRERIELMVDVVTGNATSSLGKLRNELGDTDGAFGKMKVGAAGAFDIVKQHAATAALAAGTALAGFAVKAVGEFQEVALGAGELRDALGLTAEEASRLQEVAGDLGIPISALESSIGKMNKTAANTPEVFAAAGAEIQKNADGTINVNETFLNVIDTLHKMPDAGERAAAGAKIFGKGWQDVAQMVEMGAGGMKTALAEVEDAKIIDDAEIEKSRRFRDSLDDLKGVAESFTLAVGESLVPVLTELADAAMTVKGAFDKMQNAIPDDAEEAGFDIFTTGGDLIEDFKHNFEVVDDTIRGSGISATFKETGASAEYMAGEMEKGATAIDRVASAARDPGIAGISSTFVANAASAEYVAAKTDEVGDAAERATAHVGVLKSAQEAAATAAELHAEALDLETQRLEGMMNATRASSDASFALRDAQRQAENAAKKVDEVMADEDATMQDLAEALDDSSKAAIGVADAQVRAATEAYKATGQTITATNKTDIFNRSLLDQAASLEGPARAALVSHIAQLNGIPEEEATQIQALIDQGKLTEAETLLQTLSRTRESAVNVTANTREAETEIQKLIQTRNMVVAAQVIAKGGAGVYTLSGHGAAGGKATESGAYLVGEKGPEIVAMERGNHIVPADQTRALMAGGTAAGGPIVVNVTAPYGTNADDWARKVAEGLSRHFRTTGGGSLRRQLSA